MSDPRDPVQRFLPFPDGHDAGEHICQKLSGKTCIEDGCDQLAGTDWGPLWCPEHDQERIDRVSRQMAEIAAERCAQEAFVFGEDA